MNACMMYGIHSLALCPSTSGTVGTVLHPRSSSPSFSTIISNIFFAWFRFSSFCGKKNMPTPYSRSPPNEKPRVEQALEKNLCDICNKIPTPSPVLPSASLPALCSRFSTIFNAFSTVAWDFSPLMFTTAPIPQLSCSKEERYSPSSPMTRSLLCVIRLPFLYLFLFSVLFCFPEKNGGERFIPRHSFWIALTILYFFHPVKSKFNFYIIFYNFSLLS